MLGKPAAADLKLGFATAPVLFAAQEFPALETKIQRGFSQPGDVEAAFDAVAKSRGLEKSRMMAVGHCKSAVDAINGFKDSVYKEGLIEIINGVLNRQS